MSSSTSPLARAAREDSFFPAHEALGERLKASLGHMQAVKEARL